MGVLIGLVTSKYSVGEERGGVWSCSVIRFEVKIEALWMLAVEERERERRRERRRKRDAIAGK